MEKLLASMPRDALVSTICFFAFDLLHLNGNDCRRDSLSQRKFALKQLLIQASTRARFMWTTWKRKAQHSTAESVT